MAINARSPRIMFSRSKPMTRSRTLVSRSYPCATTATPPTIRYLTPASFNDLTMVSTLQTSMAQNIKLKRGIHKIKTGNGESRKLKFIFVFDISTFCFLLSIFYPVIRIFEDFILKGDHARFVLPPIGDGVFTNGHGVHLHLDARRMEFLPKQPAHPPRMKNIRGDDEPFDIVRLHPVADGNGFVISAMDRAGNHYNGRGGHFFF